MLLYWALPRRFWSLRILEEIMMTLGMLTGVLLLGVLLACTVMYPRLLKFTRLCCCSLLFAMAPALWVFVLLKPAELQSIALPGVT
jgi:hypothetical protein